MASPASNTGKPAILVTSTSETTYTVDPDISYEVYHPAVDNTGAAANDPVFWSTTASFTASYAEGDDKGVIFPGTVQTWGPNYATIYYKLKSGAASAPILTVTKSVPRFGVR